MIASLIIGGLAAAYAHKTTKPKPPEEHWKRVAKYGVGFAVGTAAVQIALGMAIGALVPNDQRPQRPVIPEFGEQRK